jgi:hypothetical protein
MALGDYLQTLQLRADQSGQGRLLPKNQKAGSSPGFRVCGYFSVNR